MLDNYKTLSYRNKYIFISRGTLINVTELVNFDETCFYLFIINLLKLSKFTTFVLVYIIPFRFIINELNFLFYI